MNTKPQLMKTTGGRIREFRMDDYEAIIRLWEKAGLADKSENPRDAFAEQQNVARDLFLVYVIDGKVAGTVIGGWDGWRAWIYRLAVDPQYQRKGIGSKLISEIIKRIESKGGQRFRALILAENNASKSLFKSMGFEIYEKIVLATRDN